MPFFNYKVRDQKGKLVTGVVETKSEKDAASLLREQGFLVVELTSAGGLTLSSLTTPLKRVSFSDIVTFTRQLSTMITAGLTLTDALAILRGQTPNQAFAKILDDILHEIEAGNNLASALEKYPQHFSKIYICLIRAGEAGGMVDQVLSRLADNLEKQREFNSKTRGAMIYPATIVIGMVVVVFIMMTMVVPKLTALYKDFGLALPITTRILISISGFFITFWWAILAVVAGLIFGFRAWRKTPMGTRILDSLVLRLPLWGNLKKQIILVEFTRTLGLLVGAGLPILEALNIVSDSLDNVIYREGIKEAAQKVEKGFPLGVPLAQNPNFPPILGQ
ncbi:type II secretion system F family protein, partial [Candidatus Gottesmanbacteria bacterium]|nr:type II secretion system F family protein [Candidatus Gottesmanbacteria bacterium]